MIYDISVTLGKRTPWPGDDRFRQELSASLARGEIADVTRLAMSVHTGTHVDAPGHFIPGGKKTEDYLPERFILPACVVHSVNPTCVQPADLAGADIRKGDAVLFRTRNSDDGLIVADGFVSDYVYIADDTAAECVRRGASLVGLDYLGVDGYCTKGFPVHHRLLGADVLILETIDLRNVSAGRYTLICLPLKLQGSEGSPVRAVLKT